MVSIAPPSPSWELFSTKLLLLTEMRPPPVQLAPYGARRSSWRDWPTKLLPVTLSRTFLLAVETPPPYVATVYMRLQLGIDLGSDISDTVTARVVDPKTLRIDAFHKGVKSE